MEISNNFSFDISYADETGIWPVVWNSLKEELNLHFVTIKFKETLNSMKTLSSLNIKMVLSSDDSQLHLYVIKINAPSDLKNGNKERILSNIEKYKNSLIIILMNIQNSDSSIKTALKNFDKIKSELKNSDIKLLPITPGYGKISEIISDFFLFFKQKISLEINNKMNNHVKQIESYKQGKLDNKEAVYNYIYYKDQLWSYLQISEFWEELLKYCEDDLFLLFPSFIDQADSEEISNYCEPFSLLDFNENFISRKINEKTLSNIEYQQYLIYQIAKSCKFLRNARKFNSYLTRILSGLPQLKNIFSSKHLFLFWCYQFTCRLIPFIKSLKSNAYSNLDEEVNARGLINVYNLMKKFLKSLALLIKFDIPNIKLFSAIVNENITSESALVEFTYNYLEIGSDFRENDYLYLSFIKDLTRNVDEKSLFTVTDKCKMFEEYLNILNNIEKLHVSMSQDKLVMKTQIEKLPLLLILNKFSAIKNILNSHVTILKKEKWDLIVEFLNFMLLIIINCVGKNEENLQFIIEFVNMKFKNIKQMNSILDIENENCINEILSNYLHNSKVKSDVVFSLNNILTVDVHYTGNKNESDNLININLTKENKGNFSLRIQNESKLKLYFKKIVLIFEDEINKKEIPWEFSHEDFNCLNEESVIKHDFSIEFVKFLKIDEILLHQNFVINLTSIKFFLSSGIEGVYKINNESNMKINLETNNFIVKSHIETNTMEKAQSLLFYNTMYSLKFQLTNFNDADFTNKQILITADAGGAKENSQTDSSIFKIINSKFQITDDKGNCLKNYYNDKIRIKDNQIEFKEGVTIRESIVNLEVFFLIEDTDFYRAYEKKIEVITKVKELTNSENKNYLFVFKELHPINIQHIFSLVYKLRLEADDNILLQSSISLNLDMNNVFIRIREGKEIELDILQTLSLIKIYNKDKKFDFTENYFNYTANNIAYKFVFPEETLKEKFATLLNLPFYIRISVESNKKNDGVELFEEFDVKVKVEKFVKDDILIMMRIKESDNWSIIGKSRIIERISNDPDKEVSELNKTFKLIPMQDGYIKLPEIEFMEYRINTSTMTDLKNVNSLEFLPLDEGSLIEGNEKIVKVYSINSCTLRLNLI